MQIIIPEYMFKSRIVRHFGQDDLPDNVTIGRTPLNENVFTVYWGEMPTGKKGAVIETGFWWDAMHIDKHGLYKDSTLNHEDTQELINNFKPRTSIGEILEKQKVKSKYRQTNYDVTWDGIVLALQNPGDRSVRSCGDVEQYYQFVDNACKYYGKNLFLKAHPWNSGEIFERLKSSSDKYGCRIEKCNHSVIEKCKFVLVYNSTFAVDCFVRYVPVAQFAPGYFHNTGAVTFTNGYYPDSVESTQERALNLADFMAWKYCFNSTMAPDSWAGMIEAFAKSNDLFPMPEEYCYANNYRDN